MIVLPKITQNRKLVRFLHACRLNTKISILTDTYCKFFLGIVLNQKKLKNSGDKTKVFSSSRIYGIYIQKYAAKKEQKH